MDEFDELRIEHSAATLAKGCAALDADLKGIGKKHKATGHHLSSGHEPRPRKSWLHLPWGSMYVSRFWRDSAIFRMDRFSRRFVSTHPHGSTPRHSRSCRRLRDWHFRCARRRLRYCHPRVRLFSSEAVAFVIAIRANRNTVNRKPLMGTAVDNFAAFARCLLRDDGGIAL